MGSRLVLICFLSLLASVSIGCHASHGSEEALQADTVVTVQEVDSSQHLRIVVAGDLMQHERQIQAAHRPDGTYDYAGYFDYVASEIRQADVAIANLEVTLGGAPYKGYPMFSAPDEYLAAIQEAGFDLLFTANNHSIDRGKKGILRTIEMCDSLKMPHLGTYPDTLSRTQQYPYLLEQGGFRIAILEFTYGTNGLKTPAGLYVNMIDTVQIAKDIEKAKQMKPDLIMAFPHWGVEYQTLPHKRMVKLAQWFIDHGVDHVIGGHPHVIQPVELRYDSVAKKQHLVAYSLGNFVSDQSSLPKYGGMLLRIDLEKKGPCQPATIANCDYMLTFVSRPAWSHRKNYRVYPVNVPDSLLNGLERKLRDSYMKLARELFEKHNIGVSEYLRDSIY